jgi:GTP-binding protein
MEWLGLSQIPFSIVFTKTDKLRPSELEENIKNYEKIMLEKWESMPEYFIASVLTGQGRDEILKFICDINRGNI